MFERDSDEQLIRRLRRIVAQAGTLGKSSSGRRLLIAQSELQAVHDEIAVRRDKTAEELRTHWFKRGALAAYSRCAGLVGGRATMIGHGRNSGSRT